MKPQEPSLFSYFQTNTGNPVIAAPTGTGKSHIIGGFCQRSLNYWPNQRFMVLTHVKELITQNATKLTDMWPNAPLGIYSAGLGERDTVMPIIFGGVASVINNLEAFGHRDLLWIDEGHLLSPKAETLYQRIIAHFKKINPWFKVIGSTATPWRIGQGPITEGGVFTDVCYDLTGPESWRRLIAEGWLVPPIPKRTKTELDVSGVGLNTAGDYQQGALQDAVDKDEITFAALREACELGRDRRAWLAFASGIKHAEHISAMLNSFGITATTVHNEIANKERDRRVKAYKRGEIRCIVNNNVLTTGFDHPPVDFIPMLRPTVSAGLWVQMLGRGTRPSRETGKVNCLVADFAGNTRRLGPIDDPVIPKRKGKGSGDAPVKICDTCGVYNHASARTCINCGHEFTFETKIVSTAGTDELLRSELPIVERYEVSHVIYNRHQKQGNPPIIRVSYFCGMQKFDEWICLEHDGYAGKKARDWWRQRHWNEPPLKTDEALYRIAELRTPRVIHVWVNKQPYAEVLRYEY
jgi:DNA repair protein RadD